MLENFILSMANVDTTRAKRAREADG